MQFYLLGSLNQCYGFLTYLLISAYPISYPISSPISVPDRYEIGYLSTRIPDRYGRGRISLYADWPVLKYGRT